MQEEKLIRVLVVEDHEPTTHLIQMAFEARGERVHWDLCFAKDGREALEYLFRQGAHAGAALPDFVLLDWNLPKISGQEVLCMLRSCEELQTLPVLVFSSSQADDDVDAAYRARANGYIPKPTELNELFVVVENIEKFWVHTARLPSRNTRGASGSTS